MTYGEKMRQIFSAKLEDTCAAEPVDPQLSGSTVSNPHDAKELSTSSIQWSSHTHSCALCTFRNAYTVLKGLKCFFCVCVCMCLGIYTQQTRRQTSELIQEKKNITVLLLEEFACWGGGKLACSKWSVGVSVDACLSVCVCWPCDELVTCPDPPSPWDSLIVGWDVG